MGAVEEGLGEPQSREALAPAEPYRPLARLVGMQFFVYSGRGSTDVRFDNLAARELSSP